MKRLGLFLGLVALLALPLRAQDEAADDKSFLENWLQENLSSAGRQVTVTGFEGALSSQATMERLTIADDEGVWLTLEGATLDWTRSALLTGQLEIDKLNAERIEIARRPVTEATGPSSTTSDFALPELPVSINIGEIAADRVELGETVLGVPAVLKLDGGGWLDGGEGEVRLALDRIDGAEGHFEITADYANATGVLGLDLALSEGAEGIAATLTGLPGGPPLDLTLAGRGPVNEFAADLDLATDGVSRLHGRLTLAQGDMEPVEAVAEGAQALAFRAALTGDPGALLAADYGAFFGANSALTLAGQRAPDGRLRVDTFTVSTDAFELAGSALVGANGWPERATLAGAITPGESGSVLLPIGGAETRISGAEIGFDYDATKGDAWTGRLALTGLDLPDLDLATATLTGTGTLDPGTTGAIPAMKGDVSLTVTGLAPADAALAEALGPSLRGGFGFSRAENAALTLTRLALSGADYRLGGDLTLDVDTTRLDLLAEGDLRLVADDLGRFSALSGQALTGAASLAISGNVALPGGPFDVQIDGTGNDLGIGRAEVDRLFAGGSTLRLAARRDETGTRIDDFQIDAPGASAKASALLAPTGSQIDARLALPDASLVADGLAGPATLVVSAQGNGEAWDYQLDATAPGGVEAGLTGTAQFGDAGLGLVTASAEAKAADMSPWSTLAGRPLAGRVALTANGSYDTATAAFDLSGAGQGAGLSFGLGTADPLTTGDSTATFALRRDAAGTLIVDQLDVTTANLTLTAKGESTDSAPHVMLDARLRDLGVLVPALPGAFTLSGEATLAGDSWQVTSRGTGPGGTDFAASGAVAADGATADLAITGRAPLAFANDFIAPRQVSGMAAFDLRLAGPLALSSLSGQLTTSDARLSAPTLGLAFDPVTGSVSLSGGQAVLDLAAQVSSGGQITVSGPVGLSAPYTGDIAIRIAHVHLTDPTLYDLYADGQLSFAGPLTGGAMIAGGVSLSDVELQIPETGFSVGGSLDGLTHVAEPADVHATRGRAGLLGSESGGSGAVFGLDVTVSAPQAVFLRGRGLDAELGGQVRLAGTTAEVVASGGFELIRGRLDLLGNRLALTEGRVSLRGSLDPAVRLVAETQADDVTVTITVEGLASDPTVTFTSSPELPEDEILARLVFGRGLDQISPFQALKLASAVATLSGKSGSGTIGRLRDGFGLADLDVTTRDDGSLAASAGTYISDKVYTDVTVGADGKAEVNLNLTITPSLTAKGTVTSDGDTGIGIYFEKDY